MTDAISTTDRATIPPSMGNQMKVDADATSTAEVAATSTRHLIFGVGGLGLGLIAGIGIGILGMLLVPPAISGEMGSISSSPLRDAVVACDLENNSWISLGDNEPVKLFV